MRVIETTYPEDWLSSSVRWIFLIGLAFALSTTREISEYLAWLLLGASLWNLGLTILVASHRRLVGQGYIVTAVDFVLAGIILFLMPAAGLAIGWACLLPISTAAFYFGVIGTLAFSAISLLLQGIIAIPYFDRTQTLVYLGIYLLLYLVYGLVLGFVAQRLVRRAAKDRDQMAASRQEAERAERERNRALYKLISALGATLNYQRVLETAMDLGYSTLATVDSDSERMVSAVLLFAEDEPKKPRLHIGAARRLARAEMLISLPGVEGLIGRTIEEGQSQVGRGTANDAELARIVTLRACKAAYCIPLRMGLDTYGVLLYAHPEEDFFAQEQREILDIIGGQTVIAIQNARLYRDLEGEKERIMELQEEARRKLARDLHDGPTQSVAALAMRVNFARRLMDKDPQSAAEELYKVEDLARRTTKEIRHMLFTLRPLVLESQGLVVALQSMAAKMGETYNQNVLIEADEDVITDIEMGRQGVIFYIVEEAVNNARKHAQAAHAWVRLKRTAADLVLLEIEDDGIGFDNREIESGYSERGSMGLVNMRERAELINAALNIDSAVGKGTRIRLLIPLTEEAVERVRQGLEAL